MAVLSSVQLQCNMVTQLSICWNIQTHCWSRNCTGIANEWQLQKQWKTCALNLEVLPWWSLGNASFEIHWLERWNGGPHGKLTCHPWKGRILGRIWIILQPSNYRGYSLVFKGVYHEEWLCFIPSMYGIFTYVGILRRRYAPYVWRVDICIYILLILIMDGFLDTLAPKLILQSAVH